VLRAVSRWRSAGGLGLAVGALAAFYLWTYGDCIGCFFHFDDFWVLGAAAAIRIESLWDIGQFFRPIHGFVLYRPVSTVLYFWSLHQVFGYDPTGYHAAQIAFHVLNAVLVYLIADDLFASRPLALAATLTYATAPGHAIAVCWNALFTITGTALFYFLGLWAWLRFDSRWRRPITFLLFLVALLASEHAVSLPVALTLADVLLPPRPDWRRIAVQQWPFYVVSIAYVGFKLYYFHYLLDRAFPTPAAQIYVRAGYGLTFDPQAVLQHLGQYVGFSLDAAYGLAGQPASALGVGALLAAAAVLSSVGVLTGRWTSRSLRVATFGIDLFIVALGPVLMLQAHLYSYYVGIAGLGMALAVVGFARAVPWRFAAVGPATVVTSLLAVHVLWTASLVHRSKEFEFFDHFSRSAARWLYTLSVLPPTRSIDEVVVPRGALTGLVFEAGQAHRLFLCASYQVRTSDAIDQEQERPGRVVLAAPMPDAAVPQSLAWLRHACRR